MLIKMLVEIFEIPNSSTATVTAAMVTILSRKERFVYWKNRSEKNYINYIIEISQRYKFKN